MAQSNIAIYDANVLYPAPLRDVCIRVAQAGLVQAKWTDAIHDEWIRNLLQNNPDLSPQRLDRTRNLMNEAVRDCLVSGYEGLLSTIALPDPNDNHVLAAAIHAEADTIVTFNQKDFPASELDKYQIAAQHPDEFLCELIDSAPHVVFWAVKQQRESLRNPPKTIAELLDILEQIGLPQAVAVLRPFARLL